MEINNQSLQAVRELNETGGSNIRTVEKFISSTYDVEADQVRQFGMDTWIFILRG